MSLASTASASAPAASRLTSAQMRRFAVAFQPIVFTLPMRSMSSSPFATTLAHTRTSSMHSTRLVPARRMLSSPASSSSPSSSSSPVGIKPERPISPHVSIYAFPTPAITSILHRGTGVGLTVGLVGAGLISLFGSCDLPSYVFAFKTAVPALVPVAKLIVAWPFVYHAMGGVRHMFWDRTGQGLDLSSVELSSKVLIGSSVAVALVLAFVSL